MTEHFDTGTKKGRGLGKRSLDLIEAMHDEAEAAQPITGRGIGYKLFTRGLIPSMSAPDMVKVYRALRLARERGMIPWAWIVDETRDLERICTWDNLEQYARCVARSYRRDFWNQQPVRVEVWSEKGTVRGVLKPVLDEYAIGFRVMHGFASATVVNDISEDDDGRELIALYVGDHDPSGMFMSEEDLPKRLDGYGGHHVTVKRIALTTPQTRPLTSQPANEDDKRYEWYAKRHGKRAWELDAMDPRDLRNCVKREIKKHIEPLAWERCEIVNRAEQDSLKTVLNGWRQAMYGED